MCAVVVEAEQDGQVAGLQELVPVLPAEEHKLVVEVPVEALQEQVVWVAELELVRVPVQEPEQD